MIDGENDERMAAYLDEIDRLETTQEMYWQLSFSPATSDRMSWYYIGCAVQERRKLEALRRKMQGGEPEEMTREQWEKLEQLVDEAAEQTGWY